MAYLCKGGGFFLFNNFVQLNAIGVQRRAGDGNLKLIQNPWHERLVAHLPD